MSQESSLVVRTFVSRAQLPVANATVIVYTENSAGQHDLIAIRTTNESGVAGPITLTAKDSMGLTPESPAPFTDYQLIVEHPDYQIALFRDLQAFPGIETIQDVPLIPLSLSDSTGSNITTVTPQPL